MSELENLFLSPFPVNQKVGFESYMAIGGIPLVKEMLYGWLWKQFSICREVIGQFSFAIQYNGHHNLKIDYALSDENRIKDAASKLKVQRDKNGFILPFPSQSFELNYHVNGYNYCYGIITEFQRILEAKGIKTGNDLLYSTVVLKDDFYIEFRYKFSQFNEFNRIDIGDFKSINSNIFEHLTINGRYELPIWNEHSYLAFTLKADSNKLDVQTQYKR